MSDRRKDKSRYCEVPTENGPVLIPYEFYRSKRLRNMRLTVKDTSQVTLRVPSRVSERRAVEFLKSQGDWVVKSLAKLPRRLGIAEYLQKHPHLSRNGKRYTVGYRFTEGKAGYVVNEDKQQVVLICNPGRIYRDELLNALRLFAKDAVTERTEALAHETGHKISRITVRNQRTRWGSCSDRRTLSFNWRLVLLPPHLMDHIIYHELAHLQHFDHSSNYWQTLQDYDTDAIVHDHEVSKISPRIMCLGREG